MEIDVGMDPIRASYDEQVEIARAAARLGYGRFWTTGGGDPFQLCALRWSETRDVVAGGIGTAIGVLPVVNHTPAALAASAAALSNLSGGRFVLGIGSGSAHSADYRRTWGIDDVRPLALVRAYLTALRGFLGGESVSYEGGGVHYQDARLAGEAAHTPVYLGALGPAMLRLAGELADGVCLSWCSPAQVGVVRACVAEGAVAAGRDPAAVGVATYVRVCVDDDVDEARRGLARAMVNYALGWPGATGPQVYRTHFQQMGFAAEVAELLAIRQAGRPEAEVLEAFPDRLLDGLGYYGPAAGAAGAVRRLAGGADGLIVRVVPVRPDVESVVAVMEACAPALIEAAVP